MITNPGHCIKQINVVELIGGKITLVEKEENVGIN